ncbi:glycosyltransferase family 4 protein [Paenibacillus jilunlii]|uniref:Glycosyl transferase n=1 Tax=Paenibacillus jilunlii TaxID=682956 RepID=A0A1G9FYE6_9BACL|nr:glycosyltransferase family 1 protein [Paenibacillus jilunlii]KWX71277.1 glycosyl transferase [Paenibacillus jilunlii]SDK93426.1 Glycosyltransferase involved in cell wall bisynthesis [Paenibacillus jilunlii]
MRLALFTDTFLPQTNGVARTLGRLTGHLNRRGIEHLLFTPKSAPEDSYPDPVRPVASIPFFLYPECRLALPSMSSIQSQLNAFQPDLLHMSTPFNIGLCGLRYAHRQGLPHVASYHTHFDRYLEYYRMRRIVPLYWRYMKWFHRTCGATFAPSRETAEILREQGFERLRLWSRGVDCQQYSPDKRQAASLRERYGISVPLVLLYVGRIAPEKDIATLLHALQLLPESVAAGVHLLVVGDGPLLPELRAQAPRNVTFTGVKHGEELAELYASADLFVFPSSTETFGNVVLEAMASGLPVVAAGAGGSKELVMPGRTGALFQPQEPGSLAEEICRLSSDSTLRTAMGSEGRIQALGRSWEQIFDGLIRDYEEIIDSRRIKASAQIFSA